MLRKAIAFARGPMGGEQPGGEAVVAGEVPLACMPVANQPLLGHALDTLLAAGATEVAVVVDPGIDSEVDAILGARRVGPATFAVPRQRGSSLRDSILSVSDFLADDPFLIHLGDCLVRPGLGRLLATEGLGPNQCVEVVRAANGGDRVVAIDRERPGGEGSGSSSEEHAGIYAVGAGFIDALSEIGPQIRPDAAVGIAIRRMMRRGGTREVLTAPESWRFRPAENTVLEANRFELHALEAGPLGPGVVETDVQGAVRVHATAEVRSSVIRGPVVIGAEARITDSYVGPYTAIAEAVEIQNSELERSVLLRGASLRHLGSRLEDSVVGPNTRVFRDFRLPRALRLEIGGSAEISLG